jgi:hypothetical protein
MFFDSFVCTKRINLTNKLKKPIENIDAAGVDNELAVVEYLDCQHNFYKHAHAGNASHLLTLSLSSLYIVFLMLESNYIDICNYKDFNLFL